MHTFETAGFQIAYDDDGKGDPIILLHGSGQPRASRRVYPRRQSGYCARLLTPLLHHE
jgi:pimeloyl-ACP methyl ester carboxylesterase